MTTMASGCKFLLKLVLVLLAVSLTAGAQMVPKLAKSPQQPAPYGVLESPDLKLTGQPDQQQEATNEANGSIGSKLRVNVSNVCEKNHMRITVRLNRPFYGLIHAKDFRRRSACSVEGTGEQLYSFDIAYTQVQSDPNYCGVVAHHLARVATQPISTQPLGQTAAMNQSQPTSSFLQQQQPTLSVALVVRMHKSIEFSDDRYFLLSCANRCTRPDCSVPVPQASQPAAAQQLRNFITSESVVSPVLRPASVDPTKTLSDPLASWVTQRCDAMLDLKFQWLARLCWLLCAILIATICVIVYLCTRLYRKSKQLQRQASSKSRSLSRSLGSHSMRSTIRSHRAQQMSDTDDMLSKVYENNSYLAEQNKQLILANHLLSSNHGANVAFAQSDANARSMAAPVVMGRKAGGYESSFSTGQTSQGVSRQQLDPRMIGRRSIGSSMAVLVPRFDSVKHERLLDPNQRMKSRSQTTIHYDQNQDPFKAISFSYNDANNNNNNKGKNLYIYSGLNANLLSCCCFSNIFYSLFNSLLGALLLLFLVICSWITTLQ